MPVIAIASDGASVENPGGSSSRVARVLRLAIAAAAACAAASACGCTWTTLVGVAPRCGARAAAAGAWRGASVSERSTVCVQAPAAATISGRCTRVKPVSSAVNVYSPGASVTA